MPRAMLLVALACFFTGTALAETPLTAQAACPPANTIAHRHLLGLWQATFDGLPQGATLLLERHPEYAQSVRGVLNRDARKALVAGDVEDGEFTLEESQDGVNISATWTGTVIDGSCGREIRGDWQTMGNGQARAFVLRKMSPGN